jgi:hypothetical protein
VFRYRTQVLAEFDQIEKSTRAFPPLSCRVCLVCYVVAAERFWAALEKMLLTACPTAPIETTQISAIRTNTKPYSVKSWPSSSFYTWVNKLVSLSYNRGPLPLYYWPDGRP